MCWESRGRLRPHFVDPSARRPTPQLLSVDTDHDPHGTRAFSPLLYETISEDASPERAGGPAVDASDRGGASGPRHHGRTRSNCRRSLSSRRSRPSPHGRGALNLLPIFRRRRVLISGPMTRSASTDLAVTLICAWHEDHVDLSLFSVAELSQTFAVTRTWYSAMLHLREKRALSRGQGVGRVKGSFGRICAAYPRARRHADWFPRLMSPAGVPPRLQREAR